MSFGPLKNTSDYDVYVKKYLQTLQLQIALNQKNFDENVAYMKTGVQETERPDSRSIEERAGDIEKLKVQARAMLNKITDAANATEVLDYLVKNGDLLFFFIQQFPTFEKTVKKEFVGGIRAPLLISLIFKKFTAQQEESLLPESEDFTIVSNIMTKEDAETLIRESNNADLIDALELVKDTLPSKPEIKKVLDDPYKYQEELKLLSTTYKNSPNIDDFNTMVEQYNDAPLKNNPADRDLENAERDLYNRVNEFLNTSQSFERISQIPLEGTTKYKSRSSLARTIPKVPEKRVKLTAAEAKEQRAKRGPLMESIESGKPLRATTAGQPAQPITIQFQKKRTTLQTTKTKESSAPLQTLQEGIVKARGRPVGSKNKPKVSLTLPTAPTTPITPVKVPQTGSGLMNEKEQDAHRFKVLKGEIMAGNKSPEMIKELKRLVIKLHRSNELSLEQTAGILKELNTI